MEPMYCPDCTGGVVPQGGGSSTSTGTGGCVGWILGNVFLAIAFLAFWGLVLVGVVVWQNLSDDRTGVLADGSSATSWQGSYVCGDAERGLRIELDVAPGDAADRPATAFITYLSTPPGDGAEGLTTQSATGRLRGDELSLFADEAPAQDYEVVALNARIGEDADAMIGNVEATGCSPFGLELRE